MKEMCSKIALAVMAVLGMTMASCVLSVEDTSAPDVDFDNLYAVCASEATVTITGEISDSTDVAGLYYSVNGGDFELVSGTANMDSPYNATFSFDLEFTESSNTVELYADDSLGHRYEKTCTVYKADHAEAEPNSPNFNTDADWIWENYIYWGELSDGDVDLFAGQNALVNGTEYVFEIMPCTKGDIVDTYLWLYIGNTLVAENDDSYGNYSEITYTATTTVAPNLEVQSRDYDPDGFYAIRYYAVQ